MEIEVLSSREMLIPCVHIGTVGENNATEFTFIFPEEISDFDKKLTVENSSGSYEVDISENRVILNSSVTGIEEATIQVVANKNGNVWKSKPYDVYFYNSLSAGSPIIDWEGFKIDIIELLNENFDTELTAESTLDDILSALEDIETQEISLVDFAQPIRSKFYITWTAFFRNNELNWDNLQTFIVDRLVSIRDYNSLQNNFNSFITSIIGILNDNFGITIDDNTDTNAIINALNNVEISETARMNLIDTINNHFGIVINNNADITTIISNILTIQTIEDTIATIVTAINEHFETEIPTDLTTAETVEAIGEIPKGVETDVIFTYTEEDING